MSKRTVGILVAATALATATGAYVPAAAAVPADADLPEPVTVAEPVVRDVTGTWGSHRDGLCHRDWDRA